MMIRKFCISLVCVVTGFSPVFSQVDDLSFTEELNIEFSRAENKKFEKAAEQLADAKAALYKAEQSYQALTELEIQERMSDNYEQALEQLFDASGIYRESYNLLYSIFNTKGEDFWEDMERANHRAAGMDKAIYYERTAKQNIKRALIRYEQVEESDRYAYSMKILENANELAQLAIRNAGRALQICVDFPVEYNYGWEDDKTLEEVIALMRDPNVNEPPEDIFATVDQEKEVDPVWIKEIIFKVQIAAHTEPLSEEYLATLYRGGLKIDLIYEENWYKYSIGRYASFDEAEATRRECEISKAFVVAYQEGRKIGTQEAIAQLEEQ